MIQILLTPLKNVAILSILLKTEQIKESLRWYDKSMKPENGGQGHGEDKKSTTWNISKTDRPKYS